MEPLHGEAHGSVIKLTSDLGLPEGQPVEVSVRVVPAEQGKQSPGDGLLRCAGALEGDWSDEDDRILNDIAQDRSTWRPSSDNVVE